jgi:uncharacterized protein DUF1707
MSRAPGHPAAHRAAPAMDGEVTVGTRPSATDGTQPAGLAMLASDDDRDRTVEQLTVAFGEGRLTRSELDERVSSAHAARSWAQLRQLTEDLPTAGQGTGPASPIMDAVAGLPDGLEHVLICMLLCLCPPVGIWLLIMARRRARAQLGEPAQGGAIASGPEADNPARGPYLC